MSTIDEVRAAEDAKITRLWDIENIKMTVNRFVYYLANEEPQRALDELWVKGVELRKTASLGYNTGYYIGIDEVKRHLVDERKAWLEANLKTRAEADKEIDASGENLGYGVATLNTVSTPLAVVADDGKTARFLGDSIGFTTEGNPDDTATSYLTFDLVLADLVLEEGEWKIWHVVYQHDHTIEVGTNYGDSPTIGWEDPLYARFGKPTREQEVYNPLYAWEYIYQDMPHKYATYTDKAGYGPESDLGKPYYIRDPH
jgi:hypothetical protein